MLNVSRGIFIKWSNFKTFLNSVRQIDMGNTNLSRNLIVLIAKEVKAAIWLWVNKTIQLNQQKKFWKPAYTDCVQVYITLEYLQHYFIVIDFPNLFRLVSKYSFLNQYQNVNKRNIQCSKNKTSSIKELLELNCWNEN